MTNRMSHSECQHPATPAARSTCRKRTITSVTQAERVTARLNDSAHVVTSVDDITLRAIRGTGVANADELDALDASLNGCDSSPELDAMNADFSSENAHANRPRGVARRMPKRVKTPQTLKLTYELIERTIEQRGSIVVTVVTTTESTAVELTHINSATVFGTDVNGDTFSANRRDIINIRLSPSQRISVQS